MASPHVPFSVLIDSECPLCSREARFMRRMDRDRGHLVLVEERKKPRIQRSAREPLVTYRGYAADFSSEVRPTGRRLAPFVGLLRYTELLYSCSDAAATQCTIASRTPLTEIFRWLLAPTGWPVLRPLFDLAYRAFARVRPMLSRRAPSCDDGRCRPGPTS